MDILAYAEKVTPYMDAILAAGDVSDNAVIAMGAICSIALYAENKKHDGHDKIAEELEAAEGYLQDYALKSDPDYLVMAEDELSHARKPLIELKDRLHLANKDELYHYESMLAWHDSIMAQLKKYKNLA